MKERVRVQRAEMQQLAFEAEYVIHDGKRARQSDEACWLSFEVKIRSLIREVLFPMVEMCGEEREVMFELEYKNKKFE